MNDFEKALDNAIDVITELQSGMTIRVRGRVVKINLPLEVTKYIMNSTLQTITPKENKSGVMCWFVGIPCEIKIDIKNVQYVIEGDVIYENSED